MGQLVEQLSGNPSSTCRSLPGQHTEPQTLGSWLSTRIFPRRFKKKYHLLLSLSLLSNQNWLEKRTIISVLLYCCCTYLVGRVGIYSFFCNNEMCISLSWSRPAYTLRATWMMAWPSSAVSMRSLALPASSATPHCSSPTLSSNSRGCLSHTHTTWENNVNSFLVWVSFLVFPVLPLRALDSTAEGDSTAVAGYIEEVLQTLNDLIEYFKQPDSELEHEEKQGLLRSLIKRQDLFKEEVRVQCEATNKIIII